MGRYKSISHPSELHASATDFVFFANVVSPMKGSKPQPRSGAAVSQRVRYDPTRKRGNENALAQGIDMTTVTVLGHQELQRIRRVAYDDEGAAQAAQRASEEARRKQCSEARSEHWPGTHDAELAKFYTTQAEEQEETQRRLREIDELHRLQKEARRQEVCNRALLQRLREDPRGRQTQEMVHLHEAMKYNERQVAMQAEEAKQRSLDEKMERERTGESMWGDTTDAMRQKLEQRERNMAEKIANLSMVTLQKDLRRAAKAAEREELLAAQREEKEAAQAEEAESAARKQEQLRCDAFNRAHALPMMSRAQRLQQRVERDKNVQNELAREEAKTESMHRRARAQIDTRRDALSRRQGAAMETWREVKAESDRTERAQCAFTRPEVTSFVDRIERDCQARVDQQQRTQASRLAEQTACHSTSSSSPAMDGAERANASDGGAMLRHRRTAAATAGGFLSVEEENAYVAEMKLHPARMQEEERAAAAERRARAVRLADEQRLQAETKRALVQRGREAAVTERRLDESRAVKDDEEYRAYVEKQLPADIPPVMRKKALNMTQ